AGAHRVLGAVAAGGIGQDGVAVRRQYVEQVGFARVLADVGAADGDGDDLRAAGLGGASGLFQVAELAGSGEQARAVAAPGDEERVVAAFGGIHPWIIAYRARSRLSRRRSPAPAPPGRRRPAGGWRARSSARWPG